MDDSFYGVRKYFGLVLLLLTTGAYAKTGSLFNIETIGNQLNISSVVPNHVYPRAGLQIPSNCLVGGSPCIGYVNNTCLFPLSQNTQQSIALQCPQSINQSATDLKVCLNGTALISCERVKLNTQMLVASQISQNGSSAQIAIYSGNATSWNTPSVEAGTILTATSGDTVNTIWCTPSKGLCILAGSDSNDDGFMYRSTNGGATWLPVISSSFANAKIESVACSSDGNTCYAVGKQSSAVPVILQGTGQASVWTNASSSSSLSSEAILSTVVCNKTASQCIATGYASGSTPSYSPIAFSLISSASPSTWSGGYIAAVSTPLLGMSCSSSLSHCVAGGHHLNNDGSSDPAFYIYDQGSWSPVVLAPPAFTNEIVSVACDTTGMICTAVGQADNNSGTLNQNLLYTTNNGGYNWTGPVILTGISGSSLNVLQGVTSSQNGAIFTTIGRGDIVVNSVTYSFPFSYTSIDSGKTWQGPVLMQFPNGYNSSDVRAIGGAQ